MTTPEAPRPRRAWPLFLTAALTLIPGLGILFGIVAAIWGLLSNRPRALVAAILGGAGALLQIVGFAVWGSLFQENNPALSTALREATRRDLMVLVHSLDEYRARTGAYPASLSDFQRSGVTTRLVNIYDQAGGVFHIPRPYQYHVAPDGSSFDVFSTGPDRKPGTADDIRPELPDSDRAHTGYREGH